ncbi:GNAT family N-acetyltransferase [Noviherbaspirillum saxi]|uniref:N-acetyltransferase n=1 Tax=Noviherbaspirillum saxi TaxID=2320863 RepID=A0A3A3FSW7_9BURK|nr:N-acetyltransferase [Noviherbaspirillum saxi]RJF97578.1 N-acetyltransferase [Noviherbaspirillum saxi]
MIMIIRREKPSDIAAIEALTAAAFLRAPHTSRTEHFIVNALRKTHQLSVSLVAEEHGVIVGHVAVSPVSLSDGTNGWYGLGPISVAPERQRQGIGTRLMRQALVELKSLDAKGCVLLGEPAYYSRFGFKAEPALVLPGVPPEYFQALGLRGAIPTAAVTYHEAFNAKE